MFAVDIVQDLERFFKPFGGKEIWHSSEKRSNVSKNPAHLFLYKIRNFM